MTDPVNCTVFRCSKQLEMYVYVLDSQNTEELPAVLLKKMGELTEVMTLSLTAESKLARAKPEKVIKALVSDGYYLQMPPPAVIDPKMYWGD